MPIPFKNLPDELELFWSMTNQIDLLHVLKMPTVLGLVEITTTATDAFYDGGNNAYALIVTLGTEYYRLETALSFSKKFEKDMLQKLQSAEKIIVKTDVSGESLEFYFDKI